MADGTTIAAAVRMFLAAIGEDPTQGEVATAPERVAQAADELFCGVGRDPADALQPLVSRAEAVVEVRDLWFISFCPHHLLPYTGTAAVRYAPANGRVVGLGDIARALLWASRRPILQETLTEQLADALKRALDPLWVEVRLEATQLCLVARGARAVGSSVVTQTRLERDPS